MARRAILAGTGAAIVGLPIAGYGVLADSAALWQSGLLLTLFGVMTLNVGMAIQQRSTKKDAALARDRTLRIEQQSRRTAAKVRLIEHTLVEGAMAQLPARAARIETATKDIRSTAEDFQMEATLSLDSAVARLEEVLAGADLARQESRSLSELVIATILEGNESAAAEVDVMRSRVEDIRSHVVQLRTGRESIYESVRRGFSDNYRQIESLFALHDLLTDLLPLPRLRDWAASPDLARYLVEQVIESRPQSIVEIGSGASTVLMAAAAKANGRGHVTAIEHLERFADATQQAVAKAQLEDWVTVVRCSLASRSIAGREWNWYDVDIDSLPSAIDLLLVDGPPGDVGDHARYPAVPLLADRLAPEGVVVLDDYNRLEETEVAAMWQEQFPRLVLEELAHEKGTAIFRIAEGDEWEQN